MCVPTVLGFDGAFQGELALASPMLLQATETDAHKDFLGLLQLFVDAKVLELCTIREAMVAAALLATLFVLFCCVCSSTRLWLRSFLPAVLSHCCNFLTRHCATQTETVLGDGARTELAAG